MAQARTKQVKISTVMGSHFFMRGFKDYLAGRGFDPEYETWPYRRERKFLSAQWNYERGRQFAAATQGAIPHKVGHGSKQLSMVAIAEFARLGRERAII